MRSHKGLHEGLLQIAEDLLKAGRGRPSEVRLRRAISSVYYALFHHLAKLCADSFIGTYTVKGRSGKAWQQVYRALDHGLAKTACEAAKNKNFPDCVKAYAALFVEYQKKRHEADYDPYANTAGAGFTKEDVADMVTQAKRAIQNMKTLSLCDLKAFAAFLLLKKR